MCAEVAIPTFGVVLILYFFCVIFNIICYNLALVGGLIENACKPGTGAGANAPGWSVSYILT